MAEVDGLLGGSSSAMSPEEAQRLIDQMYGRAFSRTPDAGGSNYWSDLLTSGGITPEMFRSSVMGSPEAQARFATQAGADSLAGITPVAYGQQLINGAARQTSQFGPQTPTFQNFAPADAYGSAFERSLAYQSALPSLIQPFNPADMPTMYPQAAVDPYQLDIRNVGLPDWLKKAIAGTASDAAASTPTSSSYSSDDRYSGSEH